MTELVTKSFSYNASYTAVVTVGSVAWGSNMKEIEEGDREMIV